MTEQQREDARSEKPESDSRNVSLNPYYSDDFATIYHGDCRELLPALDLEPALVLTDPPYGIGIQTNNLSRSRRSLGLTFPPVAGDDEPFDPSHLLHFRRLVLFGANNYADKLPPSQSWLVWDRKSGESNTADAELAWTNLGGTVRVYRHLWNGVLRDSEIGYHVHPTQKPVALMRWAIERWTKPGDLVLDPYMGSGPVIRAAKDCGRRSIGIELSEPYCSVAVDRLGHEVLDFGGVA